MSARPAAGSDGQPRRRWTAPRALVAHAALAVWLPGCVVACWWQVGVARSGDSLGWIYSVMWPCFAVFGAVFWWHFVHDDPDTLGRRGLRRMREFTPADDDESDRAERELALERAEAEDPALAEYNAYLAALAEEARPSSWRSH